MTILGALRECNAGLQQAVRLQLESGEEGDVLTEIENLLETVARLKEKVTASQPVRVDPKTEAEATTLVSEGIKRCMDGNRVVSIQSNLTHIFLNPHHNPTATIVEKLRTLSHLDPDLLMVFAFTMQVRSWTNRSMGVEKYDVVMKMLKSWIHKPWGEEVLQVLDSLKEGTLMNSVPFKVFYDHMRSSSHGPAGGQPPQARLPVTSPLQPGEGLLAHQPWVPAMSPSQPGGAVEPSQARPSATSTSQLGGLVPALPPHARLPTTSTSQLGGLVPAVPPSARPPATSTSQLGGLVPAVPPSARPPATSTSQLGGLVPALPPSARLLAHQPWVPAMSPSQPGGAVEPSQARPSATSTSQLGGLVPTLPPHARLPATSTSQLGGQVPALAMLPHHGSFFPMIKVKDKSIRLLVQLSVLYRFLPLAVSLHGLPLVPVRAEMLYSYTQFPSFAEIVFNSQVGWDGCILKIQLQPEIAREIKDLTLPNEECYHDEVEGSGSLHSYSYLS